MGTPTDDRLERRPALAYDVFLSHSHADKEWVQALAARLADHHYNRRPLRPWLDEHMIDLGPLSSERELFSALDRSRLLAIVLSPEGVRSEWVGRELGYFLSQRGRERVIVIRHRACEVPESLAGLEVIEWPGDEVDGERLEAMISRICPEPEADAQARDDEMADAWQDVLVASSDRTDTVAAERGYSALLAKLLEANINDPAGEGLALAAFDDIGQRLARLNQADSYRMKMALGEILAYAVREEPRYAQVSSRLLAQEPDDVTDPDLSFAVLRAASKLAESDRRLVDPSTVWSALAKLDGSERVRAEQATVAVLGGRVVGKLRGTDVGDLLCYALASDGGIASRRAAIAAITMSEERSGPVSYLRELKELAARVDAPSAIAERPPERIVSLLDGIVGAYHDDLHEPLKTGLWELETAYGLAPSPQSDHWSGLSYGPAARSVHNAPMIGTIRRITTANMEERALELGPWDVTCLCEPRVVDALLDRGGAFIIAAQANDTPLCRRLRGRDRRYAMVDADRMDGLAEGDTIAIDGTRSLVLR